MKVLEKMNELKNEGIVTVWIRDNIKMEESIYSTKGYSSIENPEYVEMNKEVLNKEVLKCDIIDLEYSKEARITYIK